ncbi:hypothetical protein LXL04_011510 [Taraxacum kok-saghyz]
MRNFFKLSSSPIVGTDVRSSNSLPPPHNHHSTVQPPGKTANSRQVDGLDGGVSSSFIKIQGTNHRDIQIADDASWYNGLHTSQMKASITNLKASDYIRRFHERNKYESVSLVLPPPPPLPPQRKISCSQHTQQTRAMVLQDTVIHLWVCIYLFILMKSTSNMFIKTTQKKRSPCEKLMQMMRSFLKPSSFPLTGTDVKSSSSPSPPQSHHQTAKQTQNPMRKPSDSRRVGGLSGGGTSSFIKIQGVDHHDVGISDEFLKTSKLEASVTNLVASDYIRRFHERNKHESVALVLPPPPPPPPPPQGSLDKRAILQIDALFFIPMKTRDIDTFVTQGY